MDSLSDEFTCHECVVSGSQVHADFIATDRIESDDSKFVVASPHLEIKTFLDAKECGLGQAVDCGVIGAADTNLVSRDAFNGDFVCGIIAAEDQVTAIDDGRDISRHDESVLKFFEDQ